VLVYLSLKGHGFTACGKSRCCRVLKGRSFSCAVASPYIVVIPSGLHPARNPLFGLFRSRFSRAVRTREGLGH